MKLMHTCRYILHWPYHTYTLIPTVYRALLASASFGIGHWTHSGHRVNDNLSTAVDQASAFCTWDYSTKSQVCTYVQALACEVGNAHTLLWCYCRCKRKICWVFRKCIVLQDSINTCCAGFVFHIFIQSPPASMQAYNWFILADCHMWLVLSASGLPRVWLASSAEQNARVGRSAVMKLRNTGHHTLERDTSILYIVAQSG